MDHYCHWLAQIILLFHPGLDAYAVTLGQSTYYSCPKELVDVGWRAHEGMHKRQYARDGLWLFWGRYLWYSIKYGYEHNPYEVEAEEARKLSGG